MSRNINIKEMITIEEVKRELISNIESVVERICYGENIEYLSGQIRVGNRGSLVIDYDGRWYSHEDQIGGQILKFIQYKYDCSFKEALNIGKDLLDRNYFFVNSPKAKKKTIKQRTAEEKIAFANRLWEHGAPIKGTKSEKYLLSRGITAITPTAFSKLRHIESILHRPSGKMLPCLLAKIEDFEGNFQGVLRTFINAEGTSKAKINPNKMIAGKLTNGAVKLSEAGKHMVVTEGLEDALTLLLKNPECNVWCLVGSNLSNFNPPAGTKIVTIARDNDEAGELFADKLAHNLLAKNYEVRIAAPTNAKDFNEMLMMEFYYG